MKHHKVAARGVARPQERFTIRKSTAARRCIEEVNKKKKREKE